MPTPRLSSSAPRQINSETLVCDPTHARILCIADIRGRLSAINDLVREHNVSAVICTGDFGFFEASSIERINDRTLRHLTMYSPLILSAQRSHLLASDTSPQTIRSTLNISLLSEFPLLLSGQIKFQVPVYTVWGACEDVTVLEKFRHGTYKIPNLHVLDEATTRCLDIAGLKLRLLGIGGALVSHKFFDNGDGKATIAGGGGTMWATALQLGELVDTAQRVFDPTETRMLITHASPGREGIVAQLALVLKADLTVSAGLHFRYATSYNEFSVQPDFEGFRRKLERGKDNFDRVWENVKTQVDSVIDDNQKILLDNALGVVHRLPTSQPSTGPGATATGEEPAWKNCWNWNICDAAYGSLVFDIKEGRVSSELKSQGFNYAYRRTAAPFATPSTSTPTIPTNNLTSKGSTPAPHGESAPGPDALPDVSLSNTEGENQSGALSSQGSPVARIVNGTQGEKVKKRERKDRKDREKADKDVDKDDVTPKSASTPGLPDSSPAGETISPSESAIGGRKSPAAETGSSGGARTPKSSRPQRHPWTIFMRLQSHTQEVFSDADVKEFFKEAGEKIMKVHWPTPAPKRTRFSYIEFEDGESMKQGLAEHAEKLKDIEVEVKQATDRESRGESGGRGWGAGGRGRGRSFANRGMTGAGLTRQGRQSNFAKGSNDSTNQNDGRRSSTQGGDGDA